MNGGEVEVGQSPVYSMIISCPKHHNLQFAKIFPPYLQLVLSQTVAISQSSAYNVHYL